MTYGVYTPDLTANSMSGVDLETAKRYCYGDHVVCSQRMETYGIELHFMWHHWSVRIRPRFRYVHLGWIGISWSRLRMPKPDKIVWRKQCPTMTAKTQKA